MVLDFGISSNIKFYYKEKVYVRSRLYRLYFLYFFFYNRGCPGQLTRTSTNPMVP